MSEQQQYIPKSALDSYTNALYAERLEVGTREPTLMVDIQINRNKPQYSTVGVKVTHHIRGESDQNKHFEVQTKPQYVKAALHRLIELAKLPHDAPRDNPDVWEIKGRKIVGGKMTSEVITKGKLVVGRTAKGPFISVCHWNTKYPNIAFYPGLHEEGSVGCPASDDPKRMYDFVCQNAVGWASHMLSLLETEYTLLYNRALDNLRRAQGNGNGGGNNNSGGGNRGGGNSYGGGGSSNSYDETSHSVAGDDEFKF